MDATKVGPYLYEIPIGYVDGMNVPGRIFASENILEKATADNDYCYDYIPRLTGDHDDKVRRFGRCAERRQDHGGPAGGTRHGKLGSRE